MRRRNEFKEKPSWFIEECEALGLFRTKMPRFPQLFFYDFSEEEVCRKEGQCQDGASASRRAGTTYLESNIRLESKCGISEVWYWCLDGEGKKCDEEVTPISHGGKDVLSTSSGLHPNRMEAFVNRLGWRGLRSGLCVERSGGKHGPGGSGMKEHRLAILVEDGGEFATEDYVPSSIPEERELRVPRDQANVTVVIKGGYADVLDVGMGITGVKDGKVDDVSGRRDNGVGGGGKRMREEDEPPVVRRRSDRA